MHDFMLRLFYVSSLLALSTAACGDSGSEDQLPVNIIDFTDDDGLESCIQPNFPEEEPDLSLFVPPRFLLTTSQAQQSTSGQALVRPGDPVMAEITVNAATRQVFVELADVWDSRRVIATESLTTGGNETVALTMVPSSAARGRYYMKIALCGDDCRDREVVFETQPCDDEIPDAECAHNVPYLRTVFLDALAEKTDPTCIELGSSRGYGSGTVLIQ
jgi:hypothetical protein